MIVSHGHPETSPGGAENAAYALYTGLRDRDDVEALFVARQQPASHHGAALGQFKSDGSEIAFRTEAEFFRFSQRHHKLVYSDFRSLLEWFKPTVVHFHHYVHLGLEFLREVRNYSPSTQIVLTLHEYLAICSNDGQMVKKFDRSLCYEASPDACHRCFPDISPQDFFLRESYIKSFLNVVDDFVSPSQFLIERYVAWGLPQEKFHQIENGLPARAMGGGTRAPQASADRFGFFGQMLPFKGLEVALEAMLRISSARPAGSDRITLDVFGSRLSEQPGTYQNRIADLLKKAGKSVMVHGKYAQADLPRLLGGVDWLVIPSTWWENSPTVIQEAFANGVPVICSDIGGMAEKVEHGVNGLHFRVNDAQDLADRMVEAATTPGLLEQLRAGIPAVRSARQVAEEHVELYQHAAVVSRS